MDEYKPQEIKDPNHQAVNQSDYYTSYWKKVGDFFIGLFGAIAFSVASSPLLFTGSSVGSIVSLILEIVVFVLVIHKAFKSGRKYVGIGVIFASIIPLLLFGSCLLLLSQY